MRVKRKLFLTTAFAALLSVGAFAGVSLTKEVAKPAEVEAAVTNGKYRINVFVDSDNWAQDNIKTIFNAYSSGNQQMGKDSDLPSADSGYSNYNSVEDANGNAHRFQTVEFSARTAITKNDTTYVARSNSSSDWWNGFGTSFNLYTQFRSNYWDNTFKITGTWDNFSATLMGWYNKVSLHTGLNLGTVTYKLLKSDASPSTADQNVPDGYIFKGWYTDSTLKTPWVSGSLVPAGTWSLYVFVKNNEDTSSLTWGMPLDSYLSEFMTQTGSVCAGSSTDPVALASVWSTLSTDWAKLSTDDQNTLKSTVASETGTDAQKVMARYDVIIHNHSSLSDYMGRKNNANYTYKSIIRVLDSIQNSGATIVIIAISVTSLAAIGGYFLFKKKKEN